MVNYIKTFILFQLIFTSLSYGQNGKIFSADSELSSSLINAIFQDQKGYVWIATEDGLNKYDGAKFVTYKHSEKDSTSILNNYVKSIYEDKEHNLYFGFFNGLQIYDHGRDSFQQIHLSIDESFTYDAHVTKIIQRNSGEILIGTSGRGVFSLKRKSQSFYTEHLPDFVPTVFINDIYQDKNGHLWVLTPESGLYRINAKNQASAFFQNAELRSTLSAVVQDVEGTIYVGSYTKGLFKYDIQTSTFRSIPNTQKYVIHSLFINSRGELLVGTDGDGLYIYNPKEEVLAPYQITIARFDASKSKVHEIIEDNSHNIWLGLYQKGVVIIPEKKNNFNYIGYESNTLDIIGSNCVMSVFKDSEGILWVGTDGDGLYSIGPDQRVLKHYKNEKSSGKQLNTVVSIFEDSNHNLWIGTYLNGLAKIDRKSLKMSFLNNLVDEQNNPVKSIYSIVEDSNKNLWLGSMGSGLFKLHLPSENIKSCNIQISDAPKGPTFFNNKWINKLLLDASEEWLYVASYDGISRYNLKQEKFQSFPQGIRHFGGEIVYTIHSDNDDHLWMGTANGLIKIDTDFKQLAKYTINNGLPSNTIYSIEETPRRQLWIATNHGLSEFIPESESFLNYYFNDGLQGNEFSKNASFLYVGNELYFGGMNGITYFNPSEIIDDDTKPKILITDVYLQNTPIRQGMVSGNYNILNKPIIEADSINLSYQDNSFSLEFSSLEYRNPKRISYSYAVNEGPWIDLSSGVNSIAFENLEAGTYNFEMRSKDYDKYSSIKAFTVIIHPLWYLSKIAKIIYIFLILFFILLISYHLRQRHNNQKRLQEYSKVRLINEAKLQFLTNISHDIRTPLTLIINPLKKLLSTDTNPLRSKSYQIMMRNTDRILHLTNQLLDVRKIDKGQLELKFEEIELISYIESICALFEDQIEAKEIKFNFKHSNDVLHAWVDPNYFDKIIQNLVANSLKFVPKGGAVTLVLEQLDPQTQAYDRPYFQISVIDDGIGIEPGMEQLIFERFYQDKSTPYHIEGTGIGLNLTRSIAELHHGTIYAQNNANGKGCTFIIRIPLGCEHLTAQDLNIASHDETSLSHNIGENQTENRANEIDLSSSGRHILVVDDDLEIRNYIKKEFSPKFNVTLAGNGREALELILKKNFNLVISDIMMPEMDGLELCRRIKKNININHIPIILLTAKSTPERNMESLNLGADAYIPKPFDITILQKTALNLIQNRKLLKNTFDGSQLQKDKVKQVALESSDEILLKKIISFINENLSNSDLNVEMIANAVGISRVHLYRKLKDLTNQSASDLIKNIRLQQAADLLKSKQISVSEVAYAVGFSNLSTFSTNFKNLHGESPKKFQDKHLK